MPTVPQLSKIRKASATVGAIPPTEHIDYVLWLAGEDESIMKKLIVANWKMNPDSLGRAISLAKKIDAGIPKKKNIEVVIAPPFPFLERVRGQVSRVKIGAQDAFWEDTGAYTGEVSATMLKHSGVEYVIIGHSERRTFLRETDEMVNKKVLASLRAGLKVILCVGEPLAVRKKGLVAAKNHVKRQLKKDLEGVSSLLSKKSLRKSAFGLRESALVIAYEPIWAISTSGTGKIDTPEDAGGMIRFIKSILHPKPYNLNPRVLYGGSVDSQNARSFICYNGIDGALVGGASLKAEEFVKIIRSMSNEW